MYQTLRSFLKNLEENDLLLRIRKEVNPKYELSALIVNTQKLGKAVLFEKILNSKMVGVSNLAGSRKMLAQAFNSKEDRVLEDYLGRISEPIQPVTVRSGPIHDVVYTDKADSSLLPIVTHSENDVGPYITAGIVIAKDPETGYSNISFNRMQLKGSRKFGIRMMAPQHLGVIHNKNEAKSRNLETAVIIGNHPIEMIAGSTTLPFGVNHFGLAGAIRQEPVKLVKCKTIDVEVPADAEIVLEGEIIANIKEAEGPFADFMQYYVPMADNHVFKLRAITHRENPIYQTILAGTVEDIHLLALSREGKIYQAVKTSGTKVKNVSLVPNLFSGVISIKKRFEGEPKNVAKTAFDSYTWLKYCIVVDEDVNVYDINDVWWAMATRSKIDTGVSIIPSAKGFPRDPHNLHQSKIMIDATAPLSAKKEFIRRHIPGEDTIKIEEYLS